MKAPVALRVLKHCRCCGAAYTPEEWRKLHLLGHLGDECETLETRNCTCGTSLAQVVERDDEALAKAEAES